ncbi:hypothetical protein CRUP_030741 [Coryphaenoides rupestris]|nr:hypothetical protein CRUP_030741 [Coryphaenoides rupestris]
MSMCGEPASSKENSCLSAAKACNLNDTCKRSRLADFISNCQPEAHSVSGCLRENYADCLLSYSGLIGNAIQAFGNGTDVGVWQPQPPLRSSTAQPGTSRRGKELSGNALDSLTNGNTLGLESDALYSFCGSLQNSQQDESADSRSVLRSGSTSGVRRLRLAALLAPLLLTSTPFLFPPPSLQLIL